MSRRVLFVISSLNPMGPAQQMNLLVRHLLVNDYDVHIAVLDNRSGDPVDPRATIHPLRKLAHRDTGLTFRLRRLITSLAPEIVHSWCEPANAICGAAMYELEVGRLISSELYLTEEPSLLKKQISRRFHRRPERFTLSHEVLRAAKIRDGVREHRLVVVPCAAFHPAIDRDEARADLLATFGLPENSIVAGTYSLFEPRMRLKDLIWATDLLCCVLDNFHFVLFGEGHQQSRLQKFLSQTAASKFVHFGGTPANARELVSGLDVYWHSHLLHPLDGNLLAAMHAGIPSISAFGDGMREVVIPQTTALAATVGGRDEFARWTKYVVEQKESAEKLARQGSEHVRNHFKIARMVRGFEEIYNWCR